MNRDYLNEIRRVDISRVSGRRRDPVKVGRLLRSLARNTATPASLSTLITDVRGGGPIIYREKGGLEVDAVVETDDGRWAAFEVKLGERWVEDGANSLRRLAHRMRRGGRGKPAALAVVLPGGYGYVGGGDVGVIPIGSLGP